MFVGHYGIGLAAKRFAPQTSVGTLVFAALFADMLAWLFVVAGIEHFAIKPGITVTNPLDLHVQAGISSLVFVFVTVAWAYCVDRLRSSKG